MKAVVAAVVALALAALAGGAAGVRVMVESCAG